MKSADVPLFGCIDTIYESDGDDDIYSGAENSIVLERRRKSHTEAEQRRRNALKRGYETLRELVYTSKDGGNSARLSKLIILNKSVSEIRKLVKEVNQKNADVLALERTVETLRFTTSFYGNQVKRISSNYTPTVEPIGEEPKLKIFELLSGNLFASFNSQVNVTSFEHFADCFMNWLEDICANEVVYKILESILPSLLPPGTDMPGCNSQILPLVQPDPLPDFGNTEKAYVASNEAPWSCCLTPDGSVFDPMPSKQFVYEMEQGPVQLAISPQFSSPDQLQSHQKINQQTNCPSCNLSDLTTTPSFSKAIFRQSASSTTNFPSSSHMTPVSQDNGTTQDNRTNKLANSLSHALQNFSDPHDKPLSQVRTETIIGSQNHPMFFQQLH